MLLTNLNLTIPLVDISAFLNRDSSNELKKATAETIHAACKEVGFFYLIGHGISNEKIESIKAYSRQFFSLSEESKNEIAISKGDGARGYQKLGLNVTKNAQDWHEAIDFYATLNDSHPLKKNGTKVLTGENQYPSQPKELEETLVEYVKDMTRVGLATMHAIAMGLGLEETYFDKAMTDPFWVLRLISYPPLSSNGSNAKEGSGISCGEHTDYGCLTILNTDETKDALQVQDLNGNWISPNPIPGAFVVNIGDMLNVWTNGIYKSTMHRVIHNASNTRLSIPFFYEPAFDFKIEPIQKCVEETGGVKLYEPVVYGDHLMKKVTNNFAV